MLSVKNVKTGEAGEMARMLKALAAIPEVPGWIPTTLVVRNCAELQFQKTGHPLLASKSLHAFVAHSGKHPYT